MPYASIFIEQSGLQDSYFQMPNGKILVLYAQVGDGEDSTKLKEEVRYLLGSVRASDTSNSDEKNCLAVGAVNNSNSTNTAPVNTTTDLSAMVKADLLTKVLVPGQSDNVLGTLSDEILMETDSIGIGTGPVDYYYSETIKITLKIDRNSKTLLAVKEGKTSAF
jgi:hypothetical protein